MNHQLIIGDRYEGVLLETFNGIKRKRIRVRPLEYFDQSLRVEFPVHLREDNPLGTRFRANIKVCKKPDKGGEHGSISCWCDLRK